MSLAQGITLAAQLVSFIATCIAAHAIIRLRAITRAHIRDEVARQIDEVRSEIEAGARAPYRRWRSPADRATPPTSPERPRPEPSA